MPVSAHSAIAPSPPGGAGSSTDRAQLLAIGRRWDSFRFIPAACSVVFPPRATERRPCPPADAELALLLAANAARIGLRTLALEALATLDPIRAAADPGAISIRAMIANLKPDEITLNERASTAHVNLLILLQRGVPLQAEFELWLSRAAGERWFRTRDGDIVRRREAVGLPQSEWTCFAPHRQIAAGLDLATITRERAPVFIEGSDPPWLLQRVAAELPRDAMGYWPQVCLVEANAQSFLDALACADLRELLAQDRLALFIGPSASSQLTQFFDAHADVNLGRAVLTTRATPTRQPTSIDLHSMLATFHESQGRAAVEISGANDRSYAQLAGGLLAQRLSDVLAGRNEPLRVLIPCTRFSTFLQHSARDIAAGFCALGPGVQARVLLEPDDFSQTTGVAYARAIRDLRPDLLVMINYTRAHLGRFVPADLPVVTWVQDAMPHLLHAKTGAALGARDFVVGHLFPELFPDGQIPHERAIWTPVLASAAKFHPGPVEPDLKARLNCEIAAITHHSQTPAEYRDMLIAQAGVGSIDALMINELFSVVEGLVDSIVHRDIFQGLRDAIASIAKAHGREPSAQLVALAMNQIALPMADRFLRQQTLLWAAELAESNRWRLHIHGRGWEKHARLAKYAKGELAHGSELRAAYQSAAVNLHASVQTNMHQRVMECALSGGLPLCRLKQTDVSRIGAFVRSLMAVDGVPRESRDGTMVASVADHPAALAYTTLQQRLGLMGKTIVNAEYWSPGWVNLDDAHCADPWSIHDGVVLPADAINLCGDLEQTTFWSKETLAERVEAAITRPAWRADLSAGIAARVGRSMTYESIARRIIRLVASAAASH